MKILKLLNRKNLSILFSIFIFQNCYSNEPVDIWNLEKQSKENKISKNEQQEVEDTSLNSIYKNQSDEKNEIRVNQDEILISKKSNIVGIYDPEENSLSLDMWVNSNGKKILEIIDKIQNKNLSEDSIDILNIALLTNSFLPKKNITDEEFLKIKSNWLIKQKSFDLIKIYLEKNVKLETSYDLIKFYTNHYLSKSNLVESCEIFNKINYPIDDDYVLQFKIYCLINSEKNEEAQLQYDLLKESGFEDNFYEKKFFYLMGYEDNPDNTISEESLLNFHLSHKTNEDFKFEPNSETSKLIWRYLSSNNLLESVDIVDLEDKEKIFTIEQAAHDKNYKEEELFTLYERFMFNINQLLTVNETYKLLPNSESRALLYQGILINNEVSEKIKLIKLLKDSFEQDNISNAFDLKLSKFLNSIDATQVPSNYTNFYETYLRSKDTSEKKIKFNNKIIHQSKLLNYFKRDFNGKNLDKDLNNILKKIKKDKKYFFSTKDIILIESLKSDGVQFPKKYLDLYESKKAEIPYDIQILINKEEHGLALLRLVEIIGEDNIADMSTETLYFIISILNELNIDEIRNKILLKVLPLKV